MPFLQYIILSDRECKKLGRASSLSEVFGHKMVCPCTFIAAVREPQPASSQFPSAAWPPLPAHSRLERSQGLLLPETVLANGFPQRRLFNLVVWHMVRWDEEEGLFVP